MSSEGPAKPDRPSGQSAKRGSARRRSGKRGRGRATGEQGREFSAGGVVVRGTPQGGIPHGGGQAGDHEVVVIVPTRRAADGSRVLALPKGHVDPGEGPLQAAAREVREETGIVVGEPLCELGESRYWYRRDGRTIGKSVAFYLFEATGGDTADHDDEVEEVRWIALTDAVSALSHQAERDMVELALARLDDCR
ncbi:MAG TPA: NUDIX domain-containing protein [Solirubrobacteraceae bacterium]|jgi:8-oxo-dGTP pyrophosphatase MutT (NUDIX family)|nr:NUDIX domain-containing protein [Solirubrobacteraceae bacterium]